MRSLFGLLAIGLSLATNVSAAPVSTPIAEANGPGFVVTSRQSARTQTAPNLEAALDALRRLRAAAPNDDLTLVLPPGDIRPAHSIAIDQSLAGTGSGSLTISGAPGGGTRLLGSRPAPLRKARPGELPASVLANLGTAADALRVLEFSRIKGAKKAYALSPTDSVSIAKGRPFEVFDSGRRLVPARWPNARAYSTDARAENSTERGIGPRLVVGPEKYARWAAEPNLWIGGYFAADWSFEFHPVRRKDDAEFSFEVARLVRPYPARKKFRFFVANAYSELDQPGEFVLAPDGRSVLLWPIDGTKDQISFARLKTVLQLTNAHNVTIQNLSVEESLGSAVGVVNSRNIILRDIFVGNAGFTGIHVERSRDSVLERVVVADAAGPGIQLEGGDRPTLTPGNLAIRDSIVTRPAAVQRTGSPAVRLSGVGNRLEGSLITDAPHAAVGVRGNEHRIETSELSNVVTETNDAGAIYTARDWTARGNVIRGNFLHDIGMREDVSSLAAAIYLDDAGSGFMIERNVFQKTSRGVLIHGGRDNLLQANAFLSSTYPALWLRMAPNASNAIWDEKGALRVNFEAMPVNSELWRKRYPKLVEVLEDTRQDPAGNELVGNAIFGIPAIEYRGPVDPLFLTTDQSSVYPADPSLNVPPHELKPLLASDPRLAPLRLKLADRRAALKDLRYRAKAKID